MNQTFKEIKWDVIFSSQAKSNVSYLHIASYRLTQNTRIFFNDSRPILWDKIHISVDKNLFIQNHILIRLIPNFESRKEETYYIR